jgi:peptidoglycan/LPS O-acetylase OafA/YrhL
MKITEDLLSAKANNFTLARLILATAVIYSHCIWAITGIEDTDDVSRFLGTSIATCAVEGFFFLSGFLVYPSLLRLASTWRFALARLDRLMPALVVSVGLTSAVGMAFSRAHGLAYIRGDTTLFIVGNLTFYRSYFNLTQVFCGHDLCTINGSLWTLPYEVRCYFLLAILGVFGLSKPKLMTWLVLPLSVISAVIWDFGTLRWHLSNLMGHGLAFQFDRFQHLWLCFILGVAAYAIRRRIALKWSAALLAFPVLLLAQITVVGGQVRAMVVGYEVLCLGLLTARNGPISQNWPDYSYGLYIYAFPVMVFVHQAWGAANHWVLALATFVVTLPLSALSWHFVEKPAMQAYRRWVRKSKTVAA